MRFSRIYINEELAIDSVIDLPAQAAHYVKNVLRLKNKQQLVLFNGLENMDYQALISIRGRRVSASVRSAQEKYLESPLRTTLIQSIGQAGHMDFLIQKSTELGINHILLFNSERSQRPVSGPRLKKKLAHWRAIAISACEQCGRNLLPTLEVAKDLQSTLTPTPSCNRILLDFNGFSFQTLKPKLDSKAPFHLLVGAEGGLTTREVKLAEDAGFKPCLIGPRVLRMETAALSILNIVQHQFGDME